MTGSRTANIDNRMEFREFLDYMLDEYWMTKWPRTYMDRTRLCHVAESTKIAWNVVNPFGDDNN